MQRSPRIGILQVDVRAMVQQDPHNLQVIVQNGLVEGSHTYKKYNKFLNR